MGKPLRIAMLGWAWPPLGPREGSGMNLNVGELAAGLVTRGHQVAYLRAGVTYSLRSGVRVHRHDTWRGVGLFDLANSRNLATANFNFRNPSRQCNDESTTAAVLAWLGEVRPDLVHVHSMEGFGFDLIHAIVAEDVPVVLTPHNYYWLCPQIDLFRRESRICDDYDAGRACIGCLEAPRPAKECVRRACEQTLTRVKAAGGPGGVLASIALPISQRLLSTPHRPPTPEPAADARAAEQSLLANSTSHVRGENEYASRRRAGVAALNACHAVLCPSPCLLDVHRAMGVEPSRLKLVYLGQPHFDAINAASCASPGYTQAPWTPASSRPLRLSFHGNVHPNKGLSVLAGAIEQLPPGIAARVEILIRVGAGDEPWRERLGRFGWVRFAGAYDPGDLPAMVGEADVGLFPNQGLDNSPFVMLEHLHAGRFTLCSNVGGPRGWITPPRNGLLIPANEATAWADAIASIVDGRVTLPTPSQVHAASGLVTHVQHVDAVEREYRNALG